jgi:hypothetical protein
LIERSYTVGECFSELRVCGVGGGYGARLFTYCFCTQPSGERLVCLGVARVEYRACSHLSLQEGSDYVGMDADEDVDLLLRLVVTQCQQSEQREEIKCKSPLFPSAKAMISWRKKDECLFSRGIVVSTRPERGVGSCWSVWNVC